MDTIGKQYFDNINYLAANAYKVAFDCEWEKVEEDEKKKWRNFTYNIVINYENVVNIIDSSKTN